MLHTGTKAPDFTLPDQNGVIEKAFDKLKAADNPAQMPVELS